MHPLFALGAPTYALDRVQWIPRPIDEVFGFFEDPRNLALITPPWLDFRIVAMEPDVIRNGTSISYRLKWFGIPYRWKTLIMEWQPNARFVDTQVQGPYIFWHHTHTFEAEEEGVTVHDHVLYRLPFGPLGSLLHAALVRRQLAGIFDYRAGKIAELLADGKVYSSPLRGGN